MGINIKGLFIKEEEPKPSASAEVKEVAPKAESIMPTSTPQTSTTPSHGNVDKEIEAKIWDMIIAKNLPGPDYIEFKNTVAGLIDVIPDESMQMKGAFNVLKRSYPAFKKETILSSIDTYIGIVNEEKQQGMAECNALRQKSIGDKQETIKDKQKNAMEILRQIEELKKKHEAINAEVRKLEAEVSKATEEIKIKEDAFINSVQAVINTLNSDKAKVAALNI